MYNNITYIIIDKHITLYFSNLNFKYIKYKNSILIHSIYNLFNILEFLLHITYNKNQF